MRTPGRRTLPEIRRICSLYKPFRHVFLILGSLNVAVQLSDLGVLYVFGTIVDTLTIVHTMHDIVLMIVKMFFASAGVVLFRQSVRIYSVKNLDFALPSQVGLSAWGRIFSLSIGQHAAQHSGVKNSVMSRGLQATDSLARTVAHEGLYVSLRIAITTTAVCILYPWCGLILVVGIASFFVMIWRLDTAFRPAFATIQQAAVQRDKLQLEIAQNINLIQMNAQEARMTDELAAAFNVHSDMAEGVYVRFYIWGMGLNALPTVCLILIMWEGILLIQHGHIRAGGLVTCMLWATDALSRLEWMNSLNHAVVEHLTAIKSYVKLLDSAPSTPHTMVSTEHHTFRGSVQFDNVSFRYPKMEGAGTGETRPLAAEKSNEGWMLRNVSFSISPGESVVIVGPSGAGKSTLLKLLLRAYEPDEGRILVDDVEIKHLDISLLRMAIGVVEQNVALLDRSLRDNITFASKATQLIDHEFLRDVLRTARLEDVVKELPEGLDTILGENGVRMSGGERQRVGIARALAKQPSILFFDEATSQLDAANELLVREAINLSCQSRTVIVIAHQLLSFREAKRILVLNGGRVVGDGSHRELQLHCDWYRNVVASGLTSRK